MPIHQGHQVPVITFHECPQEDRHDPPSEPPHGLPSCPFLAKVSEESINHLDIIIQHVQVTEVLRHEVASRWPALLEEVLVVHTFQST